MSRVITALYDTVPQAELALAHLSSEVGVEDGGIVDRSVAGRTRLARMNLSAEERAVCEGEVEQGGYLLIARVASEHDPDHLVKLLKEIPRDGLGKSDGGAAPASGGLLDFLLGKSAQPAAPAASVAPAVPATPAPASPAAAPAQRRVGEFEGFRVEDPAAARTEAGPPAQPAAPAPVPPAEAPAERRVGTWEGFRVEDPSASQAPPAPATRPEPPAPAQAVAEERIPILEEELRIGTREVIRGGARVHARVEEHPVQQEVELFSERISVERRPASRTVSEEELEQGGLLRERVIEISEMREEAVVSKEAFVREELIVKKTVERRVERIEETVRRTEVETERLPGAEGRPAFGGFASADSPEALARGDATTPGR